MIKKIEQFENTDQTIAELEKIFNIKVPFKKSLKVEIGEPVLGNRRMLVFEDKSIPWALDFKEDLE